MAHAIIPIPLRRRTDSESDSESDFALKQLLYDTLTSKKQDVVEFSSIASWLELADCNMTPLNKDGKLLALKLCKLGLPKIHRIWIVHTMNDIQESPREYDVVVGDDRGEHGFDATYRPDDIINGRPSWKSEDGWCIGWTNRHWSISGLYNNMHNTAVPMPIGWHGGSHSTHPVLKFRYVHAARRDLRFTSVADAPRGKRGVSRDPPADRHAEASRRQSAERTQWTHGDVCQVYSHSSQRWYSGRVAKVILSGCDMVVVEYAFGPSGHSTKTLPSNDDAIRRAVEYSVGEKVEVWFRPHDGFDGRWHGARIIATDVRAQPDVYVVAWDGGGSDEMSGTAIRRVKSTTQGKL